MSEIFSIRLTNYSEFTGLLNKYKRIFKNCRIPFAAILKYFWRYNELYIFNPAKFSGGPQRGWEDLSDKYKAFKNRMVGFVYPELLFSGKLMGSMLGMNSDSVAEIYDDHMIMGTKAVSKNGAPYPIYLNDGTKNMRAREFLITDDIQMRAYAGIFFESMKARLNNARTAT